MYARFATLLREWRDSGRWTLLQFFGIMLGLPMFLYLTMYWTQWRYTGRFGGVDAFGESTIPQLPLYYSLVLMDVLLCGIGLSAIAANPRCNFLLPVPAWMIALSKMLPTAISAAALYIVSAGVLNVTFGAGWPLLGPALFIATTSSVMLALAWVARRFPWRTCALGLLIAAGLGLWFHTRHGASWGEDPQHYWNTVTLFDTIFLGLGLLLAYVVGAITLHFNRHEDVPSEWLTQPISWVGRGSKATFRSAERAQLWFEWRHRVYAIPSLILVSTVGIPLIFFTERACHGVWIWSNLDAFGLIEAEIVFAMLCPIWAGLGLGVLSGFIPATPKDRALGPFRGTLPVSDRWMAMRLLRAALSGFIVSGLIALAGAAVVVLIVRIAFGPAALHAGKVFTGDWHLVPQYLAVLLIGWIMLGGVLSSTISGRVSVALMPAYAFALLGLYGAGVAPHVSQEANNVVWMVALIALAYGWTLCGYTAAWSRGLFGWRDVSIAAAVWLVGTIVAAFISSYDPNPKPLFLVGNLLVTASVAPWATAPLALAWNRHR
jgi:hypothetical protein